MKLSPAANVRAIVLIGTTLMMSCAGMASELKVPTGCDLPASANGGRTFYIDPILGSMTNDGSAQRPWRTFAEVVAQNSHLVSTRAYLDYIKGPRELQPVNPNGPIKPGDTLVLMSGDHGEVDLRKYQNTDFIHVVAGPEQTPVIRSMKFISSSHWLFRGLKFQGVLTGKNPNAGLVDVMDSDPYGPGDNVIFVSNSFSTADSVSDWTDSDWVKRPFLYAFKTTSRCTTLTGNHFYNIRNAASIAGEYSLAADNLIEAMGNDGFDILASNLTIRHNVIRDGHHSPSEPMHADGIQGWTLKGVTNTNIVIDANTVIDTSQSDDNYMQGISIFDGKWDGLVVTNNLVLINIWHGIALYGVENAFVVNNTVIPSRPYKYMTWITVHPGKDRRVSSRIIVRNNIAGRIVAGGTDVLVDHNVALKDVSPGPAEGGAPGAVIAFNQSGVPVDALFRNFDPSTLNFDLRHAPKSPAIEAGSEEQAPPVDIDGRPRKAPIDVGAYAH